MAKKKRQHEAEAEASGVEPWSELLNGGSGGGVPRDDEPKKRSGKKRRREGGGGGGGGGGEGGGKSGSVIDNAQSYELVTRAGYQVVGSLPKIQGMEKPVGFDFEVFLSFRGPDTRRDIVDYLYTSLIDVGIQVFRDNVKLPLGEEIGWELLQAIKRSKISIPVFSKEYAASKWCLMELVQMVECKENWGQKIVPIFYDVEPSEVRNQTKAYGEAIQSHIDKQLYTDETIQKWKAALKEVGGLKGWELKESGKGEFVKKVAQELLIELKKNCLAVSDYFVEMDDHVNEIMELIGEQTTETKIVGIHGMGGVGKTTLAMIIYNKLSAHSTNCCFLSNCKETKIENLQGQLISGILKESVSIRNRAEGITAIKDRLSSKKVVLLLDDVIEKTQLDALVGMGKCWFDRGSKVIITTRNEEVLKHVDLKHKLTEMDFDRSLILFSRHAFKSDHPPAEYVNLSKRAVKFCGGLPLVLEIIGSLLAEEDRKSWESTLNKLEIIPAEQVEEKLNISIEALHRLAGKIFLDVCCFFIGFDARIVSHMWESCGFQPDFYLRVLQKMSLIKITEHNRLWMHDIVRDLGRDFVRKNGDYKPEEQSRVWDHEQAIDVLGINKGRENVEAIRLKFDHQFQDFIEKEESLSLSNLRYIQVDCEDLDENNVQHFPSTNLCIMLPNLRWFSWHKFPIFFQFTAYSLMKLVIFDLSRSKITDEWEGWNHLKMAKNLKVLNLTGCGNLCRTPDFSTYENLERLILKWCRNLVQVDRSIGKLKHLVSLDLIGCQNINKLPDEMEELEALTELLVDHTRITNIPGLEGMEKLETLSANDCRLLCTYNLAGRSTSLPYFRLPITISSELPFGNFGSLVELNLCRSSIQELPNSIGAMKNLRVLRMNQSSLQMLPSALGMLEKVERVDLNDCIYLCGEIPSEIGKLSFLRILCLNNTKISNIPKLPESMTELYLNGNVQMRCPDLSNLLNLRVLWLGLQYRTPFHLAPSLNWIGGLRKLESLWLDCDNLLSLPADSALRSQFGPFKELELLVNNLECLPKLPQNLSSFYFVGRGLTEKSINLSYLEKLSELKVCYCELLIEIQGLEHLKNLQELDLEHLLSLVKLPDLTGLKKLWRLRIENCPKLVEVRGQLESLESLHVVHCESLEQLLDPSSFKRIEELYMNGCWKLEEIQGLDVSENLRVLCVDDLPLLKKLPDLTNAKELRDLELTHCPCLIEIRGRLKSVVSLRIDGCGSLQKFSDPSSFKKLEYLEIKECERLEKILESVEYRVLKKVRRAFQKSRFRERKWRREDSV